MLRVDDPLPHFELDDDHGQRVSSAALSEGVVILYFYPKDDTPGCTRQACDLRDRTQQFTAHGVRVYGISADDVASHQAFRAKYALEFPLLADPTHQVCEAFGVWGEQEWQGHRFMGIARTTFVLRDGVISHVYPDVSVVGHADALLANLEATSSVRD